ncbi:MAG: KTSC domain-containing protein [Litoreibacter sp.]
MLASLFSKLFELFNDDDSMYFEGVRSNSVAEIGYDPKSRTLGVVYHNGLVFTACDFPKPDYERLRNSEFDREFPRIVLANFELERTGRRAPLLT